MDGTRFGVSLCGTKPKAKDVSVKAEVISVPSINDFSAFMYSVLCCELYICHIFSPSEKFIRK